MSHAEFSSKVGHEEAQPTGGGWSKDEYFKNTPPRVNDGRIKTVIIQRGKEQMI